MRSMRPLLLLALVSVLALTLAACGGQSGSASGEDTNTSGQSDASPANGMKDMNDMTEEMDGMAEDMHGDEAGHAAAEEAPAPVEGAAEVEIVATDLDFAPAEVELVAGEPLNVTVRNEGAIFHDFTIEEAGVHLNVDPGEQASAALVIDEPGTYEAVCTVPGHAEAGMVVSVEVAPAS